MSIRAPMLQPCSRSFICTIIFVISSTTSKSECSEFLQKLALQTCAASPGFCLGSRHPALRDLLASILSLLPRRAQNSVGQFLQNCHSVVQDKFCSREKENYTPGGQTQISVKASSPCFYDTLSPGTIISYVRFSCAPQGLKLILFCESLGREN